MVNIAVMHSRVLKKRQRLYTLQCDNNILHSCAAQPVFDNHAGLFINFFFFFYVHIGRLEATGYSQCQCWTIQITAHTHIHTSSIFLFSRPKYHQRSHFLNAKIPSFDKKSSCPLLFVVLSATVYSSSWMNWYAANVLWYSIMNISKVYKYTDNTLQLKCTAHKAILDCTHTHTHTHKHTHTWWQYNDFWRVTTPLSRT